MKYIGKCRLFMNQEGHKTHEEKIFNRLSWKDLCRRLLKLSRQQHKSLSVLPDPLWRAG
jgi:hypothetical protein